MPPCRDQLEAPRLRVCRRRGTAEQQRRMQGVGKFHGIAMAHNMHVHRRGLGTQQMIVQCRDLDPPSASFFITGFTSGCVRTKSPMTIAS